VLAPAGAPRTRRSARGAGPRSRRQRDRRARRPAGRDALEDARRPGRFRRRSGGPDRADREPGPVVHLHDRADAGRRRGRSGRSHRCAFGRR
jgi:hypothetical protein